MYEEEKLNDIIICTFPCPVHTEFMDYGLLKGDFGIIIHLLQYSYYYVHFIERVDPASTHVETSWSFLNGKRKRKRGKRGEGGDGWFREWFFYEKKFRRRRRVGVN